MIQKLINHWTERSSHVLAESLRIPIGFEVELKRAPLSGAILVSPGPKLHSVKTWGAAGGEGWGGEVGSCKKSEQYYKDVKAFFTVDLPDF